MIRVAEYVARTDTGHQRATNEDSHLERAPIFVLADGMGGAQAGEVASKLAVGHFAQGLPGDESDGAEQRLARAVREANAEIHALSERDSRRAGMGTTLTAAYVGRSQVSFAHVGDSRAYRLRDERLERITEDHSLVEELLRQGRLTEEEAEEHPQRSIITRALGPEPDVEVDTFTLPAADGDVFLICSDGLTSMVSEGDVEEVMLAAADLATAADRLVAAALTAGGRDNVTVVLFRVEEVDTVDDMPTELLPLAGSGSLPADALAETATASDSADGTRSPAQTSASHPVRERLRPRSPRGTRRVPRSPRGARRSTPRRSTPRRSKLRRRLVISGVLLAVFAAVAIGALLAAQAVYFIGTDATGQVAIYNGLPYSLPGGVHLYTEFFVSGVTVAELSPVERQRLFNNELRSQASASRLVGQLELDQIAGQ